MRAHESRLPWVLLAALALVAIATSAPTADTWFEIAWLAGWVALLLTSARAVRGLERRRRAARP